MHGTEENVQQKCTAEWRMLKKKERSFYQHKLTLNGYGSAAAAAAGLEAASAAGKSSVTANLT